MCMRDIADNHAQFAPYLGLTSTSAILTPQFSAAREHFAVKPKRGLTEDLLDELVLFEVRTTSSQSAFT